jgi:hypothetical protein
MHKRLEWDCPTQRPRHEGKWSELEAVPAATPVRIVEFVRPAQQDGRHSPAVPQDWSSWITFNIVIVAVPLTFMVIGATWLLYLILFEK